MSKSRQRVAPRVQGPSPPQLALECLPLALFGAIIFGLLISTGQITNGPEIVDDNQIFKLQIELSERGFFGTLATELSDRYYNMRRLCPVFGIQKVIQARLFGGSMVAWSIGTGLIGVLTAGLLYWFFRLCHGTVLASLAFALVVIVGGQFVLWWRLLHGEGVGLLVLSAALVVMMFEVRTAKWRYEIAFALLLTASALSKESFILAMPAVMMLKVWMTWRERKVSFRAALRASWFSIVCSSVTFLVALATILGVLGKTTFSYAGWTGFDGQKFAGMVLEYSSITSIWLLPLLVFMLMIAWQLEGRRDAPRVRPKPRRSQKRASGTRDTKGDGVEVETPRRMAAWSQRPSSSLAMAIVFCLLMTIPQLLLNMNTGMLNTNSIHFGRYIVPCIVGYSFLIAELIRLIQQESRGAVRRDHSRWRRYGAFPVDQRSNVVSRKPELRQGVKDRRSMV